MVKQRKQRKQTIVKPDYRAATPGPTQPSISILPESANKDQLRLKRQKQVWSIPFVDKRVGVQVKL